jgi:NADPH:quinone reductase-like Zn-dependent oxidoreductase
MKAAYIERFGGPDVIEFGELPEPQAEPGQVLVDVSVASVNRADYLVRAGTYGGRPVFPVILGRDFAGRILNSGSSAAFRKGDRVFGVLEAGREGTYAERLVIGEAIVARLPAEIPMREGAALGLAGLTAVVTIEETLGIKSGETILIQGGAGGAASIAIQIAKYLGAYVISTASPSNHEYVRSLGADEVIDYTTTDFTTIGRVCDAVFDTVGEDVAKRAFDVLKAGGRAAFIASGPAPPASPRADLTSLRPNVVRSSEHLTRIVQLVEQGAIKPPALTAFPLRDARVAHERGLARHQQGKFVLDVRPDLD